MKTIMTVAEVEQIAFGDVALPEGCLSERDVQVAQLRYLAPSLGEEMYAAVLAGRYTELADEWLKPALALFVKAAVLPSLALRVGAAGVVRYGGETFDAAAAEDVAAWSRRVRCDANTLLDAARRQMAADPEAYPEYDPQGDVRCRTSIAGGVVL